MQQSPGPVLRSGWRGEAARRGGDLTANSEPIGITGGADGNVWFTEYGADKIGRITPTGAITEFSTGLSPSSHPNRMALGPDGNVWFADGDAVGRISGFPAAATTTTTTVGGTATTTTVAPTTTVPATPATPVAAEPTFTG